MIIQVKLIGNFQTISHATSSIRLELDSAEGLSKILSYKVFKHIESNVTNCNHILTTPIRISYEITLLSRSGLKNCQFYMHFMNYSQSWIFSNRRL